LGVHLHVPSLGGPKGFGGQVDRIITATAKVHRVTLITKDANITDARVVPTLW
jgi:predicted nucleic acid-binding protein